MLARTAAVRGGAVVRLRRFRGQHATDRFTFTWIGGIDPKQSDKFLKSATGKQSLASLPMAFGTAPGRLPLRN